MTIEECLDLPIWKGGLQSWRLGDLVFPLSRLVRWDGNGDKTDKGWPCVLTFKPNTWQCGTTEYTVYFTTDKERENRLTDLWEWLGK